MRDALYIPVQVVLDIPLSGCDEQRTIEHFDKKLKFYFPDLLEKSSLSVLLSQPALVPKLYQSRYIDILSEQYSKL